MSVPLTAAQLRLLRAADHVCFHALGGDPARHLIRVFEDRWLGGVHSQPVTELAVDGSVRDYAGRRDAGGYRAFVMVYRSGRLWPGIAAQLRVGDELGLEWLAANDNENVRRVGFHRDELRLVVRRRGREFRLLVEVSVGPDNSARMIRWEGTDYPGLRPARRADPLTVAEQVTAALSGGRARPGLLLVAPEVADALGGDLPVGAARLVVRADWERDCDDVVVADAAGRRLVARVRLLPETVRAAGPAAAAVYRQLRADGVARADAVRTACAVAAD